MAQQIKLVFKYFRPVAGIQSLLLWTQINPEKCLTNISPIQEKIKLAYPTSNLNYFTLPYLDCLNVLHEVFIMYFVIAPNVNAQSSPKCEQDRNPH